MTTKLLTFRCPHCRTPVEVDTDVGDELLVCPSPRCGKPFRAEIPVAEPVIGAAPQGAMPAPTVSTLADQEKELQRIPLATFRRFPFRWLAYSLLAVVGAAAMTVGLAADARFWAALGGLCLAFALVRLGAWWLRASKTYLTLTNKRWLVTTGALSEQVSEVLLDHVRDVEVRQSWISRILNVGDLVLFSENGDRTQVIVMGVPNPRQLADRLRLQA